MTDRRKFFDQLMKMIKEYMVTFARLQLVKEMIMQLLVC